VSINQQWRGTAIALQPKLPKSRPYFSLATP